MDAFVPSGTQWTENRPVTQGSFPRRCVTAGISLTLAPPGMWTLIWCQRHCHKAEHAKRKDIMRDVVMSFGGKLMAAKSKFSVLTWAQSDRASAYVLVTDWREIQPFMKNLRDMSDARRPCFSVLLCSSERQFRMASTWAQALPLHLGQVYACMEDQIPPSLLAGVIRKCFSPMDDATHDDTADNAQSVPDFPRPSFKDCMDAPMLCTPMPVTLVRMQDDVLTIQECISSSSNQISSNSSCRCSCKCSCN